MKPIDINEKNLLFQKKIFKNKAQIAGQIFIFILAILLAALILLYGYNAVNVFIKKTEQIALIGFEKEITTAIRTIASDYASVKKLELAVPSKYKKVCLIQLDKPPSNDICINQLHEHYNPLVCDAWKDKTQNVFLVPMAETTITVSTIEIEDSYLCIPVKHGRITLRLEGLGNKTKVSEWVNNV